MSRSFIRAPLWRRFIAGAAVAVLPCSPAVLSAPPATLVKQADSLIDARGMTLALNATYGIMINGAVSANDVLVSANGYQYCAYYVKNVTSGTTYHVAAGRRRAPTGSTAGGAWEIADLTTSTFTNGLSGGVPWNSHCAIALGIDLENDKIHLAWDMHNKTLRYRATPAGVTTASPAAWSAALFGTETSRMGGSTVTNVTYPNFVRDANGSLGFFYRYGTSSSGYWQTRDYDGTTATPSWSSAFAYDAGTGTDPATGSASRTAYPNGFSIDRNNRYHMTFVWREDVNGGGDGTNHDLCYAYSDDKGLTWHNNAGGVIASQSGRTKITIASPGLVVRPIPQGNGLMNTQGQEIDSSGRVHTLMYHRDTAKAAGAVSTFTPSVSSYFHYWRDGLGNWHRSQVPFDCTGSRPRMYFDAQDNAVAILADGSLRVFAATKASNWTDWTLVGTEVNYLSDSVADRDLFRTTGVLSVFEQRPPSANLAASEVRSLDFIPTFQAPTAVRFAAADGVWAAGAWLGGAVPGGDGFAIVDAGRRATLDASSGTASIHSLGLGTANGSGGIAVTGGTLRVAHAIDVGREAGGRGDYQQSGGSVACDRFVVGEFVSETSGGGASAAVVSGGSLAIRELAVAVAAGGSSSGSSFTVLGGTVTVSGEVVLGDCGNAATLDVQGGTLTVAGDIGPGVNGTNRATLRVDGGVLDATGNAVRVDRLVLGGGDLRNATTLTWKEVAFASAPSASPFSGTPALASATNVGGAWSIFGTTAFGTAPLEIATPVVLATAQAAASSAITVRAGGDLRIGPGLIADAGLVTLAGGTLSASSVVVSAAANAGFDAFTIAGGRVAGSPALTVRGGGVMTMLATDQLVVPVSSLVLDLAAGGGRIDIGAGRIEIAAGGIAESALRAGIVAGRNGGLWNGATGIGTSRAEAGRGVGYAVLGDGSAVVSWAACGDTNLDGLVDLLDAADFLSAAAFDKGTPANWTQGDGNYDGVVDILDVVDMIGTGLYGTGSYLPNAGLAASLPIDATVAAVPEPSAWLPGLVVCGLGTWWLPRRRCISPLSRPVRPTLAEVPLVDLFFALGNAPGTGANSNDKARAHTVARQSCRPFWRPHACRSGRTRITAAGSDLSDLG